METNADDLCTILDGAEDCVGFMIQFHEELGVALLNADGDELFKLVTIAAPMSRAYKITEGGE